MISFQKRNKFLLISLFIFSLLLILGCTKKVDWVKDVTLGFKEDFNIGNKQGYADGLVGISTSIDTLHPLKSTYTVYEIGYIDGYSVSCHEKKFDCHKVDSLVEGIQKNRDQYPDIIERSES